MHFSNRLAGKAAPVILLLWGVFLACLPSSRFMKPLDAMVLDRLFRLRGHRAPPDDIIIVGFDRKTHREIHRHLPGDSQRPISPFFWNPCIGSVIEGLARHGAGVIGLDMLQMSSIDEPVRALMEEHLRNEGIDVPAGVIRKFGLDMALIKGIVKARGLGSTIVLAYEISDMSGTAVNLPHKRIRGAAGKDNLGFVNFSTDVDSVVRRLIPAIVTSDGQVLPSFALRIAAGHTGAPFAVGGDRVELAGNRFARHALLNYYGPSATFTTVSFVDVLDALANGDTGTLARFDGATVLIGSTTTDDIWPTPYSRNAATGLRLCPGIEIQATAVQNLIAGEILREPEPALQKAAYYVVLAAGFVLFLALPTWISALVLLALAAGIAGGGVFAFIRHGLALPMAAPLLAAAGSFAGTTLYRLYMSEKKRHFIRHLFGQYIDETIVRELMANPEYLNLEGELREITVLFADLRGFTTFSENNTPETVVAVLNRYFEAMTEAILENGGIVDKFIGDGIMAFFGPPLGRETHARQAAQAAQDMKSNLVELNGELGKQGIRLRFGVGIHSGVAIVGNVGSQRKLEYTVIGDTVNTAARIESENKILGTEILLSLETYKKIQAEFEAERMGGRDLKGKKDKVIVYRMLADGRKTEKEG